MKQQIRRYGTAIFAAALLFTVFLNAGSVYAVNVSAELAIMDIQNPEDGILFVSFSVAADAPVTISGDAAVSGGVFLGLAVPGCLVRNKRFVYNAGTQSAVSGVIRIGVTELTDITVTVTGSASSVYDFSTSSYYGSLTVTRDMLAGFVPAAHTEPAPEGPGSDAYLTLPEESGTDPGQSARDASIAEQIREEQEARAASEALENQEEANRMRDADERRLANEEAERQARGQQAGVLPKEEREVPGEGRSEGMGEEESDSEELAVVSSNTPEAGEMETTVSDNSKSTSGSPVKSEEQEMNGQKDADLDARPTGNGAENEAKTGQRQDREKIQALSALDWLLIAGGISAVFVFLLSMVKVLLIFTKNK